MENKDRRFLSSADLVRENYKRRITTLKERYHSAATDCLMQIGGIDHTLETLDLAVKLDALQTEAEQHQQRVRTLREQQRKSAEINKLCAEANKLSGTDGLNFWKQAGRALTPKENTDATDENRHTSDTGYRGKGTGYRGKGTGGF